MKESVGNTPSFEQIRDSILQREEIYRAQEITSSEIADIKDNIHHLYQSFYGQGINIPITILPPIEKSREDIRDSINMSIPRGKYYRPVALRSTGDKRRILGANESGEGIIYLINGDTDLICSENPSGVFRTILAHEYTHGQTQFKQLAGVENPPLKSKDIYFPGELHYVTGFKAVSYNLKTSRLIEPTENLDEWITQYLSMAMFDNFNNSDVVIEQMKKTGLGINTHKIEGAEILHSIFSAISLEPTDIEKLHHFSDISGLIEILEKQKHNLGKAVIRAGSESNSQKSLRMLKRVKREFID